MKKKINTTEMTEEERGKCNEWKITEKLIWINKKNVGKDE